MMKGPIFYAASVFMGIALGVHIGMNGTDPNGFPLMTLFVVGVLFNFCAGLLMED